MNISYDNTSQTAYNFFQQCCFEDDITNIIGICSQKTLDRLLGDGGSDKWTQFFISDIVDIPIEKPDMESINTIYSSIKILSQRAIRTPVPPDPTQLSWEGTKLTGKKLIVEGILTQKIMYTSSTEDQALHSAHFSKPFSIFIIIDGNAMLSAKYNIVTCIEDVYTCRLSERSIFKNTTIFMKAVAVC